MRRVSIAGTSVLVGSLLLGLSGCASKEPAAKAVATSSSATSASLDPCRLVTQQQVVAAVGMQVDPGQADTAEAAGSRGCTWLTAYGKRGGGPDSIASITVEVVGPNPAIASQFPTAHSYYDFLRHQVHENGSEDVSGIGDAAFLTERDSWLYALKGKVVLRVFATFGKGPAVKSALEQLMKDALAKV